MTSGGKKQVIKSSGKEQLRQCNRIRISRPHPFVKGTRRKKRELGGRTYTLVIPQSGYDSIHCSIVQCFVSIYYIFYISTFRQPVSLDDPKISPGLIMLCALHKRKTFESSTEI